MILLCLLVVIISPIFGQEEGCDEPIGIWDPNKITTSQIRVPDQKENIDQLRLRQDTEPFILEFRSSHPEILITLPEKYNITGIVYRGKSSDPVRFEVADVPWDKNLIDERYLGKTIIKYDANTNLENVTKMFSSVSETAYIGLYFTGELSGYLKFQFELLGCKEIVPTTESTTTESTTTTVIPCYDNLTYTTSEERLKNVLDGWLDYYLKVTFDDPGPYKIRGVRIILSDIFWPVKNVYIEVYKREGSTTIYKEFRTDEYTVIVDIKDNEVNYLTVAIITEYYETRECYEYMKLEIRGCKESEAEAKFPIEEKRFLSFRPHDHQPYKQNDN